MKGWDLTLVILMGTSLEPKYYSFSNWYHLP